MAANLADFTEEQLQTYDNAICHYIRFKERQTKVYYIRDIQIDIDNLELLRVQILNALNEVKAQNKITDN